MDDERTQACKTLKAAVRVSTPTLCFVAASVYLHRKLSDTVYAHAVEFWTILLVALALFAVVLTHAVLRPENKDTWPVALLEVAATVGVSALAVRQGPVLPYEDFALFVARVSCVLFMLAEAKQLNRAFTALSDWLSDKVESVSTSETLESALHNTTLVSCLVCCVVAAVFDFTAYEAASAQTGTTSSFVVGGLVALCVLAVCVMLVLPRASLLVVCLSVLFASAQLCMLVTAQSAAFAPPKPQARTGWLSGLARFVTAQDDDPRLLHHPHEAEIQLRPSTVVAGVLALVACVTSNAKRVYGENEELFRQVPETLGERVLAGLSRALPVLVPAYPCWAALNCVPCCHPGLVLMQVVVLTACHCLSAAGIEVHLFPHED